MYTEKTRLDQLEGLLREACTELRRRFLRDPSTRSEDVLADYPDLARSGPRAVELIRVEWELRRGQGEPSDLRSWCKRFPQWRELLVEHLARDSSDEMEAVTTVVDGNQSQPLDELGQDLSDHEVYEELGRGGMGVVYRAYDRVLKRTVALKVIRSGLLATPEEVRRFYREARTAAQLEHPNLLAIYGMGRLNVQHSFTMPLADGGSLARRRQEFADPVRAVELLVTLADAVAHAHSRGIVHRDLKPANVLFTRDDRPLVSDFGLARAFLGSGEVTLNGQVLGTPSYMAPEQAAGQSHRVGPASDVWSLGVILYELVVGERPFVAETSDQLLACVLAGEFERPRQRRPNLDPALEQILLRCLRKEPQDRYADAAALRDDLKHWLAGQELSPDPSRPRRPRRTAWVATATVFAVLLLVGLVALPLWLRSSPASGTTGDTDKPRRLPLPQQLSRGEGKLTAVADGGVELSANKAKAWADVCDAPPWPAYSFRVEMGTVKPGTLAVGVYWDYDRLVQEQGESCWFVCWTYSTRQREFGDVGQKYLSSYLSQDFRRDFFSRAGTFTPLDARRASQDSPIQLPPGGRIVLNVQVRPTGYQLFLGETPAGPPLVDVSAKAIKQSWTRLFAEAPPIKQPLPAGGRGKLGLYCQDGAATFRNFVLEPLP